MTQLHKGKSSSLLLSIQQYHPTALTTVTETMPSISHGPVLGDTDQVVLSISYNFLTFDRTLVQCLTLLSFS